jgi:hypothetical protein
MNPFPDELHLLDVGFQEGYHGRCFKLEQSFRVKTSKGLVTIPDGTLTDGASIPQFCQNLFSPIGPSFPCAIYHDYYYSKANKTLTRKEVDDIFLELMYNVGVGWFERTAIHSAVRLFGGRFYKGLNQ